MIYTFPGGRFKGDTALRVDHVSSVYTHIESRNQGAQATPYFVATIELIGGQTLHFYFEEEETADTEATELIAAIKSYLYTQTIGD